MLAKIKKWQIALLLIILLETLSLVGVYFLLDKGLLFFSLVFLLANGLISIYLIYNYQEDISKRTLSVSQILGNDAQTALLVGKIGIMTYDDEYEITWVSELFEQHQKALISKKVIRVLPELKALFNDEVDEVELVFDDKNYLVMRKEEGQILFWRDITLTYQQNQELKDNALVIGLIHLDNYNEMIQNEDEQVIALINSNLRQPIDKWAKSKQILIRRLRSDRFILVLNEKIYQEIEQEYFSILDYVRTEAQKINVAISLSMSFARGSYDLMQLDDMANNLLELAQSRGGDQVVMRIYSHETKYFGGNTEAVEKRSKVKARVMARTLKDIFISSGNVFVVGHRDVDFDCMGSMLAVSKLAQQYNKEVYVITQGISYDEQLARAFSRFESSVADNHNLISEEDALILIQRNSLVICMDHHHLKLCSASILVNKVSRLAVIDHHRRGEDFFNKPVLVYIEQSASSTSEMMAELIEYQPVNIELSAFEATLMLTGIIMDTNHFRLRSSTRTFEAAGFIKSKGADNAEADSFLKDNFEEFEKKNSIYKYCERLNNEIIIVAVDNNEVFKRTTISKAADSILNIYDVEAVFVVAASENNHWVVSARSKGYFNVQVVVEKMQGGGHFSAAGLQRSDTSVKALKEELLGVLGQLKSSK